MKKKNLVNLITSALLLSMGILILFFPTFKINEPVYLMYILFGVYSIAKFIEYILTRKELEDDYESIYTGIACIIASASGLKFHDYNAPMVLSITLISWVGTMAIIKLIKLDYYHDRKNGMFYVNLITFALFLLIGFLTSINLYFNETVQTLMLGFFFVINGLLSITENFINIIYNNKKFKLKVK